MTVSADLANNLPKQAAVERIAEEVGVPEDYVHALADRLQLDPSKHAIPMIRLLDEEEDLVDPDKLSDEEVADLQKRAAEDAEESDLSEEERADLAKYEGQISQGLRQSAEAFRQIKKRKLYREDYTSWNTYIEQRWQISGTSADNHIAWLRMTEMLEKELGQDYRLNLTEAKALLKLREHPELAAEAIVAAEGRAKEENRKRETADVVAEVERRRDYALYSSVPKKMTLDEFQALRAVGVPAHKAADVIGSVREGEAEGLTFEKAMEASDKMEAYRNRKTKEEKQKELNSVKQKIKEIKEGSDLKSLSDQEKKLKEEIEALKKPTGPPQPQDVGPSEKPPEEGGAESDKEPGEDLATFREFLTETLGGFEAWCAVEIEDDGESPGYHDLLDEIKGRISDLRKLIDRPMTTPQKPR
jgi:hypothetical protein